MSLARNHAVQTIMQHADFDTFLNMRLVCKQWQEWSRTSTQHWYDWLCEYAPRDRWVLIDHAWATCDAGEACRVKHHFRVSKQPPKILKTMPLCDQVFRIGAQKLLKKLDSLERTYVHRIADLGRQLATAEATYKWVMLNKQQHEIAAEELLQRLDARKRRRISKPTTDTNDG